MAAADTTASLLLTLEREAPEAACQWLRNVLQNETFTHASFLNAYASTGRRFGSYAERARTCLLLHACDRLPAEQHTTLIRDVFRTGDNAERSALLRALSLLPAPERFVETAIEACRSHVQDVFEAIACDNPYPATHFPDLHFQQMVMKALFTSAPLARVIAYRTRITDELQRMVKDYAAERTAAGRTVPDDVALILQGATR
jgi:hypothetical protein